MLEDHIGYNQLIDDAMRGIILKVIDKISKEGFEGDHHFLISFFTRHKGVMLSQKLLEVYPESMTIILQYQFEELRVEDNKITVTLSFDGIKEHIVIPVEAIISFADPAVRFGLKFGYEGEDLIPFMEDMELLDDELGSEAIKNAKKKLEDGKRSRIKEGKAISAKKDGATKNVNANVVSLDSFRHKDHDKK